MGVFTMYCPICGCPLFDLSYWVEDKQWDEEFHNEEEEEYMLKDFELSTEEGRWLNDVVVITKHRKSGISEGTGGCDCYGCVEIYSSKVIGNSTYNVCPLNFDPGEKHGFGVHKVCYSLFVKFWNKKICTFPKLHDIFDFFKETCDELSATLGIDYGGIEENWGQEYELKDGEDHYVKPPNNLPLLANTEKGSEDLIVGDLLKSMGFFYRLPFEIVIEVLKFLNSSELLQLSQVSKFFYNYSKLNIFWKPLFESRFFVIEEESRNGEEEQEKEPEQEHPLKGVTICISQIANPERTELRNKALKLGAEYSPTLGDEVTHLVCPLEASKNTDKVRKAIISEIFIVSPGWIEECFENRKKCEENEHFVFDSDLYMSKFAVNDHVGVEADKDVISVGFVPSSYKEYFGVCKQSRNIRNLLRIKYCIQQIQDEWVKSLNKGK